MSMVIRSSSCKIFVGDDVFIQLENFLSENYSDRQVFILVDEHTKEVCLPVLVQTVAGLTGATVLEMKSGEKNKSLATCEKLWKELTEQDAHRSSLLINLGGGMVGDVGSFVAATFMRGIDFINIPTSLLAMVDASAGGKNGINFSGLKNQVGTFTQPVAVFISPSFLKTLPERDLKSGFAEVIKHALIADKERWNELKNMKSLSEANWIELIGHSVHIKNEIVSADFKERNTRKTLNFGHTIGHALESYSMEHAADPLKHGEAIAVGMIGELFLSQKLLAFPDQDANEIISFIQRQFGYVSVTANTGEVVKLIHADKKNEQQELNFSLLSGISKPVINQRPTDLLLEEAIEFSLQQVNSTVDHHG